MVILLRSPTGTQPQRCRRRGCSGLALVVTLGIFRRLILFDLLVRFLVVVVIVVVIVFVIAVVRGVTTARTSTTMIMGRRTSSK